MSTILREDPKAAWHINQLKNEKMKTHSVVDGSQRVLIIYEALAGAQNGDPCLATIYKYTTENSTPTASREKEAKWNSDWDFDIPVNGEE